MKKKSYYIEYITIDHQVKATAIDPETGLEATVIAPSTATRKELSSLAIKKLQYVIKKNQGVDQ